VPGWLVERLEVFRRVLEGLQRELDAATDALEEAAPAQLPKGLGGVTYETICREIGDWNRFSNRRQVGSYTGLCGGVSASGKTGHLLPITKHGNVRLRTALIELAWRMVFWQKDCKTVQKWRLLFDFPGRLVTKRAARKKAIVAIARQMAVDLWRPPTTHVISKTLAYSRTAMLEQRRLQNVRGFWTAPAKATTALWLASRAWRGVAPLVIL